MKRVLGSIILVLLIALLAGAWLLIRSSEMSHLQWFIPAVILIWLGLLSLWYLGFGPSTWKRRLIHVGGLLLLFVVSGSLAATLLDYDGSASGSSFPKFRWVWEAEDEDRAEIEARGLVRGEISADAALKEATGESLDFLGPDRDGMEPDLTFSPDWETDAPRLLWRRPIGKGWSSFAVADRRAITQEQSGGSERVVCLDVHTGREIWHHENEGIRLLDVKKENAGARMGGDGPRATPVVTDDRVFAYGSTGILDCLELETGEPIWERDVLATFGGGVQKWGMANAPLLLGPEDLVVVPGSDNSGVTLVALRQEDGSEAWRYEGSGASYSSPRLLELHGVRQVVSVNRRSVTGHDPASGALLWKEEWPGAFPKVAQPLAVSGGKVLVTASYGAGSFLLGVAREGNAWSVDRLWKSNRMKTKFSSAVIRDGVAYGLDEGRLAAIDLETGDKIWKNQKFGFGQQLLFGDHLLVQTEPGPVVVGPVSAEGFVETGRIEALSDMTWNVPTVAGRLLLVRNDREAACYVLPAPREIPEG